MASTRTATGGRQARAQRARGRSTAQRAVDAAQADASRPKRPTGKARDLARRVGRPTGLTEDLAYGIGDMVLAGNYRQVAAAAHGVSRATLNNWLARGEELEDMDPAGLEPEQALYVEFLYVLKLCEAHAEAGLLADARRGGTGWQAYVTLMERRWPARWKRRDEIEHSGEIGTRSVLSPEERERELAAFGMPAALHVAAGPESVPAPEEP